MALDWPSASLHVESADVRMDSDHLPHVATSSDSFALPSSFPLACFSQFDPLSMPFADYTTYPRLQPPVPAVASPQPAIAVHPTGVHDDGRPVPMQEHESVQEHVQEDMPSRFQQQLQQPQNDLGGASAGGIGALDARRDACTPSSTSSFCLFDNVDTGVATTARVQSQQALQLLSQQHMQQSLAQSQSQSQPQSQPQSHEHQSSTPSPSPPHVEGDHAPRTDMLQLSNLGIPGLPTAHASPVRTTIPPVGPTATSPAESHATSTEVESLQRGGGGGDTRDEECIDEDVTSLLQRSMPAHIPIPSRHRPPVVGDNDDGDDTHIATGYRKLGVSATRVRKRSCSDRIQACDILAVTAFKRQRSAMTSPRLSSRNSYENNNNNGGRGATNGDEDSSNDNGRDRNRHTTPPPPPPPPLLPPRPSAGDGDGRVGATGMPRKGDGNNNNNGGGGGFPKPTGTRRAAGAKKRQVQHVAHMETPSLKKLRVQQLRKMAAVLHGLANDLETAPLDEVVDQCMRQFRQVSELSGVFANQMRMFRGGDVANVATKAS